MSTGSTHARACTRSGDIRRAARVSTGDPLLLVNLGAVRARVEQLPWVKRATVQRDLPGRLRITVTERTAVAWSRRSVDRVTLVDATGRVLGDERQPPPGVPQLVIPSGLAHPGANVQPVDELRVIAQLPAALRVRVASVALGARGSDAAIGVRSASAAGHARRRQREGARDARRAGIVARGLTALHRCAGAGCARDRLTAFLSPALTFARPFG